MTLTTTPAAPAAEEPPSAAQTAVRRYRSGRGVALFILAIFGITLILAAIKPRVEAQYLDPTSAKRDGARALTQVLGQRGIQVQVSRNARDAATRMTANPASILVVVRSDRLLVSDLRTLAGAPGDRLLVEPTKATLEALAPWARRAAEQPDAVVRPGCTTWPDATAAGSVGFGPGYTYETSTPGASQCYLDDKKARLIRLPGSAGTATMVISSGTPFTNQHLAERGNAALALNLLQARRSVVWLIPDLPLPQAASPAPSDDQTSGGGDQHQNGNGNGNGGDNGNNPNGSAADQTFWDLVPDGVYWAMLQLAVVTLLIGFWRGRRLGTVVAERLPVIVRSAETVEGRARLYRGRRARGRAAEALRAGTRERLAPRLGIARGAAQDPGAAREIVRAVAGRTEWDETTVGWALYGPEPADDAELIRLSDFLGDLESKVLGA